MNMCEDLNQVKPGAYPGQAEVKTVSKLGIVVPIANEQKTLAEFVARVKPYLKNNDILIISVDNACKDSSRKLLADIRSQDKRVIEVWSPQNKCVVDAYFAGYRAALENDCDWILEMDAGFSHKPEEIPRFLCAMGLGYDYVGGSRYLSGGSHKSPLSRVLISRGGTLLTKLVLNSKMTDMTSGFECFTNASLRHVVERGVRSRANFFQTEIKHMMHSFKWTEVPINYTNTNYKIGRTSIRESFRILFTLSLEKRK